MVKPRAESSLIAEGFGLGKEILEDDLDEIIGMVSWAGDEAEYVHVAQAAGPAGWDEGAASIATHHASPPTDNSAEDFFNFWLFCDSSVASLTANVVAVQGGDDWSLKFTTIGTGGTNSHTFTITAANSGTLQGGTLTPGTGWLRVKIEGSNSTSAGNFLRSFSISENLTGSADP